MSYWFWCVSCPLVFKEADAISFPFPFSLVYKIEKITPWILPFCALIGFVIALVLVFRRLFENCSCYHKLISIQIFEVSSHTSGSRFRNIYILVFSIIANNSALSFEQKQKKNRDIRKLISRYREHPRRHHIHEKQCCEYVCLFNRCIQRPTFQVTCSFPFALISLRPSKPLRQSTHSLAVNTSRQALKVSPRFACC